MLYIIATPIGNLEDITKRAERVLSEVDFILAEDTRKTVRLLDFLGIKKKMVSFYEHNEQRKIDWAKNQLKQNKNIALVSSAGTPTISDPGYRLIRECRKENLEITSLPGASSVINALSLTSIPHEKFTFFGYFPRKRGGRKKSLESAKETKGALVFFESPFRIEKTLQDIKDVMEKRTICVIREMTKKFEEVLEMKPEQALKHFQGKKPKGEFVIIIEGEPLKRKRGEEA